MNVRPQWGVEIPMRDGIHLSATVYRPPNQASPAPCIFLLSPYIADLFHDRGMYFASRGLPFVAVDARGRGNSAGTFRPHIQEAADGYDVVEWLARQPWCNGKVGMWGGSYLGYAQWATAKELPPHLATIVPVAAPCSAVDSPMRNNIFYPCILRWLAYITGRVAQPKTFMDGDLWASLYREWYESGRSFRDLDAVLGNRAHFFQEWLDHPEPDEYWDAQNPTAEQYSQIRIPILTITGAYDDDQPGALEHYRNHLRNASPAARARHYLIIGPWNHSGTGVPVAQFGGLTCGPASLVDLRALHLEWYAWTLQEGPKPAFLEKTVAYYVTGAEEWRYVDALEEATASHEPLFLCSNGSATDVYSSGSLTDVCRDGPPDSYTFDPRDTSGSEVECEARASGDSLVDQSVTLALQGRELIYHSAPFEADTEITGFFRFNAWIAIDCPDTDFYVSVYEIDQQGGSLRLSTDGMRARYREGLRTPKLIQTRDALRYDFERFTFVSRRVRRGHRLRLVIAPIGRLVEGTFVQKNYNGGGVVAEESVADARPVTVRLFHDTAHPSVLHVPLGRAK